MARKCELHLTWAPHAVANLPPAAFLPVLFKSRVCTQSDACDSVEPFKCFILKQSGFPNETDRKVLLLLLSSTAC